MEKDFAAQVPVTFELQGYELQVPSGHIMRKFHTRGSGFFQPYREHGLALVARALERRNRGGTIVDVGANVGDTLAVVARNCTMDVLCVEPSEFFSPYLRENVARHFADRATVVDWYVTSSDDEPAKALYHWGGTAKPIDGPPSEGRIVVSIGQLIDEVKNVALLKVDTDGADLAIVEGCIDSKAPQFPIYFELEITTADPSVARTKCSQAQQFFNRALEAGYRRAFVWDDPGRFYGRLDLASGATIPNLLNYLTQLKHRPVWGFDVCLVHDTDVELFKHMSEAISEELFVALD